MIVIDDADDPRLAVFRFKERRLASRPQRRDDSGDGLFLAEGDLVVERALQAGCVPMVSLVDAAHPPTGLTERLEALAPVFGGGDQVRMMVTQLGVPNSVVTVFHRPARATLDEVIGRSQRVVVIEAVDNPANVGAIIRNAVGLGWDGLLVDHTSADPLSRRSLRVSMGHALHLPYARYPDIAELIRQMTDVGYSVCALTPAADALDVGALRIEGRVAVVIGSERAGLSAAALASTTHRVRIPMANGVDSLNAAAASAIACFALRPS